MGWKRRRRRRNGVWGGNVVVVDEYDSCLFEYAMGSTSVSYADAKMQRFQHALYCVLTQLHFRTRCEHLVRYTILSAQLLENILNKTVCFWRRRDDNIGRHPSRFMQRVPETQQHREKNTPRIISNFAYANKKAQYLNRNK